MFESDFAKTEAMCITSLKITKASEEDLQEILDLQRKGYGRRLVTAIEKCCPGRRYELFTSTRSVNNIRLYELLGYKKFDERDADGEIRFVYLEK